MSIASEITRLQSAKANLKTALEAKGVTVPADAKLDEYPELVDSIPSGGGDTSVEDGLIDGWISGEYTNNRINTIRSYAFYQCERLTSVCFQKVKYISSFAFADCQSLNTAIFPAATVVPYFGFARCSNLTTISFPMAVYISSYAFSGCRKLTSVEFPLVTNIESQAFYSCSSLKHIDFPLLRVIGSSAFYGCSGLRGSLFFSNLEVIHGSVFRECRSLSAISVPKLSYLGDGAFSSCYYLTEFYLNGVSSVPYLAGRYTFSYTPIGGYTNYAHKLGSIYVPASLYDAFLSAANWSYLSSRFVSV